MSAALIVLFIYTVKHYGCLGAIIVHNISSNQTENTFPDAEAFFGSQLSQDNPITGFIFAGNPVNGCAHSIPLPKNASISKIPFIALVKRGQCSFTDKAMAAQRGNFSAVVVYNDQDDSIFPMSADSDKLVRIPAVMVGLSNGTAIRISYCYSSSKDYVITITANEDINTTHFIAPIVSIIGLLIVCTTVYCGFRCYARRQIRRRRCLTRAQLNTIPVITFVEDGTSDSTCPICLEEFANQDQLRLLPCRHVYHCRCVDHWLLKGRRVCPVCKRPTHARRHRQDAAVATVRSAPTVGPAGAAATNDIDTEESDFEDDETENTRPVPSLGQELAREEEVQPAAEPPPSSAVVVVNETTPLLAGTRRPENASGWRWPWRKNRRKSFVTGWLNSNPFQSQPGAQEPQPSTSSRATENPQISVTVGVPVTVSEDCGSPQVSTSRGFSTVQAIVHQAASPTDIAHPD